MYTPEYVTPSGVEAGSGGQNGVEVPDSEIYSADVRNNIQVFRLRLSATLNITYRGDRADQSHLIVDIPAIRPCVVHNTDAARPRHGRHCSAIASSLSAFNRSRPTRRPAARCRPMSPAGNASNWPITRSAIKLDVHGPILLSAGGGEIFANEVFTVEPGLYSARFGGVRVEDMVTVTPAGPVNFNRLPDHLDWR